MNAKKVKQLRKLVREMSALTPESASQPEASYTENEGRRKYADFSVDAKDENGAPTKELKRMAIAAGTVTLNPRSRRGFYQQLKKSFASGNIAGQAIPNAKPKLNSATESLIEDSIKNESSTVTNS